MPVRPGEANTIEFSDMVMQSHHEPCFSEKWCTASDIEAEIRRLVAPCCVGLRRRAAF